MRRNRGCSTIRRLANDSRVTSKTVFRAEVVNVSEYTPRHGLPLPPPLPGIGILQSGSLYVLGRSCVLHICAMIGKGNGWWRNRDIACAPVGGVLLGCQCGDVPSCHNSGSPKLRQSLRQGLHAESVSGRWFFEACIREWERGREERLQCYQGHC